MFRRTQRFRILAAAFIGVCSLVLATPLAYAKAPPLTSNDVFILLPGIESELSKDNIKDDLTPDFESIRAAITNTVPDAQFVTFSYTGPTSKTNPKPRPYTCVPTIETPISSDVKVLSKQVQAVLASQPNANIYLIGHSLGGVIAYGYMGMLAETQAFDPTVSTHVKGVITLDSPLGGVSSDPAYLGDAETYFETNCSGFNSALPTALLNLTDIFNSYNLGGQPRGGKASVLAVPFPKKDHVPQQPAPSNQTIAQDAHNNLSINTLTVGNWNDLLWDPAACDLSVKQFIATQWIWSNDQGDSSGMYGRAITSGDTDTCFLDVLFNQANHLNVLSDPSVMQGIQQFITGQTPSALPPADSES